MSLVHLVSCKSLSCLDISHNHIDDPTILGVCIITLLNQFYLFFIKVLSEMVNLRVLYLFGNPVVKKIPNYRRTVTISCKQLTYLDDRPIFTKDRAAANAWVAGGDSAEVECRRKWLKDEQESLRLSVLGKLKS